MILQMVTQREPWRWTMAVSRLVGAEAQRAYPGECCGWLLGPGPRLVTAAATAGNEEYAGRARARYLMTADSYRRAEAAAGQAALQVVGVYHSHPDHPATPSTSDLAEAWPSWLYVIVPVSTGTPGHAQAWMLQEDRSAFHRVLLEPAD